MKTKRVFLAVFITALIVTIVLISLKAYYVAIALIVGALLISHREVWPLLKKRKLPLIDERVQENMTKAVRNGFIFLVITLPFLMLYFSVLLIKIPNTVHLLGGLFISTGMVYMLSYLFYNRVEPKLDDRGLKILKIFLLIAGISLGAFITSVFLHNAIYSLFELWFGKDFWNRIGIAGEPVFF